MNGTKIKFDVGELCDILKILNYGLCLFLNKKSGSRSIVLNRQKLYRGCVSIRKAL